MNVGPSSARTTESLSPKWSDAPMASVRAIVSLTGEPRREPFSDETSDANHAEVGRRPPAAGSRGRRAAGARAGSVEIMRPTYVSPILVAAVALVFLLIGASPAWWITLIVAAGFFVSVWLTRTRRT